MDEPTRRLFRSQHGRMLFGVCGGLADYLLIDATVVRLILVALTIMVGPSIIAAYLILALLVPESTLERSES